MWKYRGWFEILEMTFEQPHAVAKGPILPAPQPVLNVIPNLTRRPILSRRLGFRVKPEMATLNRENWRQRAARWVIAQSVT